MEQPGGGGRGGSNRKVRYRSPPSPQFDTDGLGSRTLILKLRRREALAKILKLHSRYRRNLAREN